jgi:pimeloyl-ACP methyl ester carboxylesterase
VILFWLGLALLCSGPVGVALVLLARYIELCVRYRDVIARIFSEKPLFIVPRGQPVPDAEDVRFPSTDGRMLAGCYLKGSGRRRGVILFGLEFGSNRWSCQPYCEHLLAAGYDVFAFETRSQGDSEREPDYDPLQWVTDFEVRDAKAAVAYLKGRPDADPPGIGFFGISKGAGAGLFAAALDPYVRCCVTDGVFAVYTTLVPYMRHWFRIYNNHVLIIGLIPSWFFGAVGLTALRRIEQERHCHFPHLERALRRLRSRPLFMIHGANDTYIKPDMARTLFRYASDPKELWIVEGAKHNQALNVAGDEYSRRVLEFFDLHLAQDKNDLSQSRKERNKEREKELESVAELKAVARA